jgi:hypothetical protein
MTVSINGTSGIVNDATDLAYTGTLTGGTGVVNLGSGQVYKDASGNVGIGTSSPSSLLHVSSSAATNWQVRVSGTSASNFAATRYYNDAGSALDVGISGSTASYGASLGMIGTATNNPLTFKTNDAERARIASDGKIYIACTAAPSATVAGVRLGNPVEALCAFSSGAQTTETYQLGFYNGNGLVGRISTNGSATSYVTSSDYRLKEDIAPMTGALSKVALLKPCTYKWKVDGSDGQGFIAHELDEVVPGCVTGEKDAVDAEGKPQYQGIDTSFLVATLAAAIQEQQTLITALTARITALETA